MSRKTFKTDVTKEFFEDPAQKKTKKLKEPEQTAQADPAPAEDPGSEINELRRQLQEIRAQLPAGYKLVKENKTERMQFLVRPTTKKGLQELAKIKDISINELANIIFEEYIERAEA